MRQAWTLHITARVVLLMVLLATLILATVSTLSYQTGRDGLTDAATAEMLAVALEKEAAIDAWFGERVDDLTRIAVTPGVVTIVGSLAPGVRVRGTPVPRAGLMQEFAPYITGPGAFFTELFVMSPDTGQVMASTTASREGQGSAGRPYFEIGRTRADLDVSRDAETPSAVASAPVRTASGRVIAVLGGRLDLAAIGAIVQRRSGRRETEDAFLIDARAYPVIAPRFVRDPAAALRVPLDTEPARRCAARESGVMFALDYRGVPVIAACRWDDRRQIGLIVKIDQDEALAPVRALRLSVAKMSILALVGAAMVAVLLARTITRPLRELHEKVRRFNAGGADDAPPAVGDEVADLADQFDRMTARVAEQEAAFATANAALVHMTAVDGLTGIANRRRFDEVLSREWARALREQRPLSMLMGDIDFFKNYNDRYGHLAGDACLQRVASAIEGAAARSSDLVARYGGEEIAVILPSGDVAAAAQVAETIRARVMALGLPHEASAVASCVTLSLGVATVVPTAAGREAELVAAADAALYAAKRSGRNCVMTQPAAAEAQGPAVSQPMSAGRRRAS